MITRLLIATTNPGKAAEFREMLRSDTLAFEDLKAFPHVHAPEETGLTFLDNASLKASWYAQHCNRWTIADDSGLAVDALNGAPGVHSARWAQMNNAGSGDAANNALLLSQMEEVPEADRTAAFHCALALADPVGHIVLTANGTVKGRILRSPRGSNGFGYDPLFLIEELRQTTAELSPAEKHAISHRGQALRDLRDQIDHVILGKNR